MAGLVEFDVETISQSAAESIDGIEKTEQGVINHLRTAGLRQSSETALVDDILKIRKDRRRVFSAMQTKLVKVVGKVEEVEAELRGMRTERKKEREEHSVEMQQVKGMSKDQLGDQALHLKRKFENKLKELNAKYESYLAAQEKEHTNAVEEARKFSAKKEMDELSRRNDNENLRLIKSLHDAVAEISTLKETLKRKDDSMTKMRHECVTIHSKLEEEKERRKAAEAKLSQYVVSAEILGQKLNTEREYARELSDTLDRQQEERSLATESLDCAHAKEMDTLEGKVRVALNAKDEQIHTLTGRCTMLETELESIQFSLKKLTL
jgi:hypothetical protein